MPKLDNKYSDSRLDPSEGAFNDLVSTPDMQSLNDQGDAIARDNEVAKLREAENDPGSNTDENIGTTPKEPSRSTENRFGYPTEDKQRAQSNPQSKRNNLIKFGAGGGVIGGILIAIMMLLPLKIPGIMQMISDEAGQRVEQITERRAKIIIARAIFQKFATSGSGVVITGDGPVGTLIASMRVNRFEKKLADKGLTIEKTSQGVRLSVNGQKLENGRALKNDIEVYRALDGHPVSNKIIKDIVKEEIPSWRLMKKMKFAKWLRIKYGIPKYGITNSTEADEETRIKEMRESQLGPEYEALANDMGEATECFVNTECDFDQEEGKVTEDGKSKDLGAVEETTSQTGKELATSTDPTKTLITQVVDKIGSKAIPIIGWIDLVATVDHIAWEASENQYFGKLAAHYRAKAYARHFGNWSGYASQIQLGAMDPAFIGTLATQTIGIEESQAFNLIEGDASKGIKPEKINANNPGGISKDLQQFTDLIGGSGGVSRQAAHGALNLYYESLGGGGLLGWASDKIGGFISKVIEFVPGNFEDWFGSMIKKAMGKLFAILGLDFDPKVQGAQWFNAAHGGATWTYNDFCKVEMGCRKLSSQQAQVQNSSIASERATYAQQKGLGYSLLSMENSKSFASQFVVNMPTNTTSTLAKMGKIITSSPSNMLGMITGKTSAAGYTDIHGVDPYGATENDLNQPVAEQAMNGDECPEVAEDQYNGCLVDTMVAEAMVCEFIPDSEDCNDGGDAALTPTGDGSEFTVASYNILHSDHHTDKSIAIGGCNTNPVPGDPKCMKTRGDRQVKIITGKFGNPAFDIFGTQETAPTQYEYLKKNLPGYAAFPETTERMNNMEDGAVAIFWNTAKFQLVESGKARGKSNTSKYISNPWVGLQTSSGQKVYVMSIHYAVAGYGGTPESIRESSNLTMDWVKSKSADDNIVIVVGDFNDRLPEEHYCIYTKNSAMQHAVDMSAGASLNEGCTKRRFGGIDHIYATPTLGLTASKWTSMADNGEVAKASDHVPVYTTYVIPGADTSSGGGWVWPMKNGLKPGPCYKSTSTGRVHAGMDINSDSTTEPALAMHDGTIVKTSSGGADGNSVMVKSTDGKFYWYQHLSSVTKTSGEVKAGEPIGVIGATGNVSLGSSSSHLHIVVFTKAGDYPSYGSLQSSIDPMSVLPSPAPGGYKCT